jgi:hypothetical protein
VLIIWIESFAVKNLRGVSTNKTIIYSIPVCIGINMRIMIRAYIVFYRALIFVCSLMRIRMIRVFI